MSKLMLIVSGMHRSNTSLLAGVLANSGLRLGDNLVEANASNPSGHFEDVDFVSLHRRMLKHNHTSWRPWFRSQFEIAPNHRREAQEIVARRFENLGAQWGFKVPDATLFLPLWSEFKEARFLFIFRSPFEVYSSLLRRVGLQLYYKPYYAVNVMLTYVLYNRLICDFCRNNSDRCYLIHNKDFIESPELIVNRAREKLKICGVSVSSHMIDQNIVARNRKGISEHLARILAKYKPAQTIYQELLGLADSSVDLYESKLP